LARIAANAEHEHVVTAAIDLQRIRTVRAAHTLDDRRSCPYPRLSPYDTQGSAGFIGRERNTVQLAARLAAMPAAAGCLLAVVGGSGSGKSSLIRAGLLPLLADGIFPAPTTVLTPSRDRIERVLDLLDAPAPQLLVVDQFEETFTVLDAP